MPNYYEFSMIKKHIQSRLKASCTSGSTLIDDKSARMASMLSSEETCIRLSLRKLRMMIANRGKTSRLSKPRIYNKHKVIMQYDLYRV